MNSLSVKTGRSMDAIAAGEACRRGKSPRLPPRRVKEADADLSCCPVGDARRPAAGRRGMAARDQARRLSTAGVSRRRRSSFRTRNGQDWTAKFPAISAALEKLNVSVAVLDLEAVVLEPRARAALRPCRRRSAKAQIPSIVAFVFDLLHLDGRDLTNCSCGNARRGWRRCWTSRRRLPASL